MTKAAAELVALRPAVIMAVFTPAIGAAMKATTTIPVVFNGAAPDSGLVKNVARPEGNATGVTAGSLSGKCLQLLKEVLPAAKSLGVVLNLSDPYSAVMQRDTREAAPGAGVELVEAGIRTPGELEAAFDTLHKSRVAGMVAQPSVGLERAAALALKHRLPAISIRKEFAGWGGLMSFAGHDGERQRLVAVMVDKILKGARPADLPVQQTTRFELTLNLKTARALGLTLPPTFLVRADEVIE